MIKDTGFVYTYEVSFFGNYKEVKFQINRILRYPFHLHNNILNSWADH